MARISQAVWFAIQVFCSLGAGDETEACEDSSQLLQVRSQSGSGKGVNLFTTYCCPEKCNGSDKMRDRCSEVACTNESTCPADQPHKCNCGMWGNCWGYGGEKCTAGGVHSKCWGDWKGWNCPRKPTSLVVKQEEHDAKPNSFTTYCCPEKCNGSDRMKPQCSLVACTPNSTCPAGHHKCNCGQYGNCWAYHQEKCPWSVSPAPPPKRVESVPAPSSGDVNKYYTYCCPQQCNGSHKMRKSCRPIGCNKKTTCPKGPREYWQYKCLCDQWNNCWNYSNETCTAKWPTWPYR